MFNNLSIMDEVSFISPHGIEWTVSFLNSESRV